MYSHLLYTSNRLLGTRQVMTNLWKNKMVSAIVTFSYSAMTLLPYSDHSFSGYQSASAQETKYAIGQQIQSFLILCSFGQFLETVKNSGNLLKMLETYIKSTFNKVQKL